MDSHGRQSKKPDGTEAKAIIAVEILQLVIEAQISIISQGQTNSQKEPIKALGGGESTKRYETCNI